MWTTELRATDGALLTLRDGTTANDPADGAGVTWAGVDACATGGAGLDVGDDFGVGALGVVAPGAGSGDALVPPEIC